MQKGKDKEIRKEIEMIRKTIDKWKDEIAEPHKDEILKMLEGIDNHQNRGRIASTVLNYAVGTGYTMPGDVDGYAAMTATATDHYLMSPLINGDNQ